MQREDIYKKTNQKGGDRVLRNHNLWYRNPGLAPALKGTGTERLPESGRKVSVSKLPWGWGGLSRGTQLVGSAFRERARGTPAASLHLQLGLPCGWTHLETTRHKNPSKAAFWVRPLGQRAGGRLVESGPWGATGKTAMSRKQAFAPSYLQYPPTGLPVSGEHGSQFAQDNVCDTCLAWLGIASMFTLQSAPVKIMNDVVILPCFSSSRHQVLSNRH